MSALTALALAGSARADVIPEDYEPPTCTPVTCLRGAVAGGGSHGSCPTACVPWSQTCTADAECGGPGWRCVPTRFCLEMRPTGRMVQNVVLGECADDGTCAEGTCTVASRCVPDGAPPAASTSASTPSASGSSCAASPARADARRDRSSVPVFALAWVALAAVVLAPRRGR